MGVVQIDIHKDERPHERIKLTDPEVVEWLIVNREKLDPCFELKQDVNFNIAGAENDLNQELIATYSDLDNIIKKSNFNQSQHAIIRMVSIGYTLEEIGELVKGVKKQSIAERFQNICKTIVETNNEQWSLVALKNNAKVKWVKCNGECRRELPLVDRFFRSRLDGEIQRFRKSCRSCEYAKKKERERRKEETKNETDSTK